MQRRTWQTLASAVCWAALACAAPAMGGRPQSAKGRIARQDTPRRPGIALGKPIFEAHIDLDRVSLGRPEEMVRGPGFVGGYTILTKTPADVRQRSGLTSWQFTRGCTVDIVHDPLGVEGRIALCTAPAYVRGKACALDKMTRPENRGHAAADRQDPPRLGNIVVMTARLFVTSARPEYFRFMDLEMESDAARDAGITTRGGLPTRIGKDPGCRVSTKYFDRDNDGEKEAQYFIVDCGKLGTGAKTPPPTVPTESDEHWVALRKNVWFDLKWTNVLGDGRHGRTRLEYKPATEKQWTLVVDRVQATTLTQDMAVNFHPLNVVDPSQVGPNMWQIGATIFNRTNSPVSVSVGLAQASIGWYEPADVLPNQDGR